jgi:hypothetical protein
VDDESLGGNGHEQVGKNRKERYIEIQKKYRSIEIDASAPQAGQDKRSRMVDGLSLTDHELLESKDDAMTPEEPLLESTIVEILNQEITHLEIEDLKSDAKKMRREIANLKTPEEPALKSEDINNRREITELKRQSIKYRVYFFIVILGILAVKVAGFKGTI